MKLVCQCCSAPQSRKEAAAQPMCPACTAARCTPAYTPWCHVREEHHAWYGDPVGGMFACGPGGCEATYYYGPPQLELVEADEP